MAFGFERAAPKRTGRDLLRRGAVAIVGSILLNWLILTAVVTTIVGPYEHLQFVPVTFWTTVGAIGAVITYGLIDRFSDSPDRTFIIVAAVVLVLSFVPDIGLLVSDPEATVGAVTVLMIMHVTVAAISVATLTDDVW